MSFELNGAQHFSKLDFSQAYRQLELEEESRYITTFSTHFLLRYKRLNYETNAAAEIFQYILQAQLHGLKGVKNIANDIIIYGTTREEHDENLDRCLKRLVDRGLCLNQSKCTFLSDMLECPTKRAALHYNSRRKKKRFYFTQFLARYSYLSFLLLFLKC